MFSPAKTKPCPPDEKPVASSGSEPATSFASGAISTADSLPCVIAAPDSATLQGLAKIAHACARDLGMSLRLQSAFEAPRRSQPHSAPVLTLHLPVELAASQHQVWCLACRLACFCPSARVSVLVLGQDFSATSSLAGPDERRRA